MTVAELCTVIIRYTTTTFQESDVFCLFYRDGGLQHFQKVDTCVTMKRRNVGGHLNETEVLHFNLLG